jgi:hypothetical protein
MPCFVSLGLCESATPESGAAVIVTKTLSNTENSIEKTRTRALMGTNLNDFNGRPQTTNLGVGGSNLSGRATNNL